MCGRFGLTRPEKLKLERFGVTGIPLVEPRFNITPGTDILVVRARKGERRADLLHWGLVPSWAKDPTIGRRMANARSDTAFEKPAFRTAITTRRCLIPADVFYEWQEVAGSKRKQPHAVRMRDHDVFALGGIWEYWRPEATGEANGDAGEAIVSCAILTTRPNSLVARLHDRMPVIVAPDRYAAWLDPSTPLPAVEDLMQPFPSEIMESWAVSLRVNNAKEDGPEVLEPAAAEA